MTNMDTDLIKRTFQVQVDQDLRLAVADNMRKFGGSFVQALAECLVRADTYNRMKLISVFENYIAEYLPEKWENK